MIMSGVSYTVILWILLLGFHHGKGQTHADVMRIFDEKLNRATYRDDVRPIQNQSEVMRVVVFFELLSIVEINDASQSFICNGVVGFAWLDEIVAWDPIEYGGHTVIYPKPKDIWRPRVVLLNTLEDRDIFKDDYAPTSIVHDGSVLWLPGSLFPTSCQLDITKYPFDKQTCYIELLSMGVSADQLQFHVEEEHVMRTFFTPNGEWELLDSKLEVFNSTDEVVSGIRIAFMIRRHPIFSLLNIILPVVLLSALNLLVFVIPAESGEKISYGITVLLALAVFMSIVSGMLPRSSDKVPKVTIYLFSLLILSTLTVVDSVIIVYLHNKEGQVEKHQKAKDNYQNAFAKVTLLRRAVNSVGNEVHDPSILTQSESPSAGTLSPNERWPCNSEKNHQAPKNECEKPEINKYRLIGKYIDLVSFVIFALIWLCFTAGFMTAISEGYKHPV